jgi:hypothetical protein
MLANPDVFRVGLEEVASHRRQSRCDRTSTCRDNRQHIATVHRPIRHCLVSLKALARSNTFGRVRSVLTADAEEDAIVFRRLGGCENWLMVMKECPVSPDDVPPRRRELPKRRKL